MVHLRLRVSLHPVTNRWAHLVYPKTAVHSVLVLRIYSQQSFLYVRTLQSEVFSLFSSISIGGSLGIRHFERNQY
jgi:hypothetical protein